MSFKDNIYLDNITDYTTGVQAQEYFVKFPPKPNLKEIVNYGLPIEKQVFKRTTYNINGKNYYPSDLIGNNWELLPEHIKKEIFTKEFEYRTNGRWYFINGRTIFINGFNYFFLNYFKPNTIHFPNFWDSQWLYYQLLEDSFYAKDVYGLMYIKGRRGGGTATNNSTSCNIATLYKNSNCGLMNYNTDQCQKVNFTPIRESILKLPDFFLPEPYLKARSTGQLKKVKTNEQLYFSDVNNYVYSSPTKETGFDGTLQRFAIIDEVYKFPNTDPMVTLEKNILCIKDGGIKNNIKDLETGEIIKYAGLCVFVSSVDEVNDTQIQSVNKMWRSCSPDTATENSCSTYSTRRYFEPASFGLNGYIDNFGFSKMDKAQTYINNEYNNILKNIGFNEAREFKRKNPLTIDDALTPSANVCQFNFEILNNARNNILSMPLDDSRLPVFCQLEWEIPFKKVYAVPKPQYKDFDTNARFCISGHPKDANNIKFDLDNIKPLNGGKYLASLDPVDYNKSSLSNSTTGSLPCIRVKRLLDMTIDGGRFDADGKPLNDGLDFETNRTVLTYFFRPNDIKELWNDIAKILIYYGCPLIHERSTRTIFDYLDRNNMFYFILDKKGQQLTYNTKDDFGIKTTKESKQNYFDSARAYIELYGMAERHIEVIDQLIKVTEETMTDNDIATAFMIGECISSIVSNKYKNNMTTELMQNIFGNLKF